MKTATQKDYAAEMAAFNDIWKFLKKYYFIESDMEEWACLVSEAGDLCTKHKSEFSRRLIHLVLDHLESLQRERELHGL